MHLILVQMKNMSGLQTGVNNAGDIDIYSNKGEKNMNIM